MTPDSSKRPEEGSPQVTAKDVARAAGVSTQLVSAILHGSRGSTRFSEAARERVLAAAAQLGFQPNVLGRSLRSKRSFLIGVLNWKHNGWLASALLQGIQTELASAGLTPLFLSHADAAEETKNLQTLSLRHVDAIITAPCRQNATLYTTLNASGTPIVELFDDFLSSAGIPNVLQDMEALGYLATRHLTGLGHRDIALLTHDEYRTRRDAREHWEGYLRAMTEAGLKERIVTHSLERFVVGAPPSWYACTAEVEEIMLGKDHPTAAVCYDSHHAGYLIHAAQRRGLPMPATLSQVGFHDWDICTITTPGITTLEMDAVLIGREAARLVMARLSGHPAPSIRIPPLFIERGSTSQAPR